MDLKQLLNWSCKQVSTDLSEIMNISYLYGSFCFRDLNKSTLEFESYTGDGGLFDKKPDFIVEVSDLEKGIKELGKNHKWTQKNIDVLLGLDHNKPFYFNLETLDLYSVPILEKVEHQRIPYKIGIVQEGVINKSIYIPARLSKPNNVVFVRDELKKEKEEELNSVRDYFISMALSISNNKISKNDFLEKYALSSYLCEVFRVFDIVKKKYKDFSNTEFYDLSEDKVYSMSDKMNMVLTPLLLKRDDVLFDDGIIRHNVKPLFLKYLKANVECFLTSVQNGYTNRACGASSLQYILRKCGINNK